MPLVLPGIIARNAPLLMAIALLASGFFGTASASIGIQEQKENNDRKSPDQINQSKRRLLIIGLVASIIALLAGLAGGIYLISGRFRKDQNAQTVASLPANAQAAIAADLTPTEANNAGLVGGTPAAIGIPVGTPAAKVIQSEIVQLAGRVDAVAAKLDAHILRSASEQALVNDQALL